MSFSASPVIISTTLNNKPSLSPSIKSWETIAKVGFIPLENVGSSMRWTVVRDELWEMRGISEGCCNKARIISSPFSLGRNDAVWMRFPCGEDNPKPLVVLRNRWVFDQTWSFKWGMHEYVFFFYFQGMATYLHFSQALASLLGYPCHNSNHFFWGVWSGHFESTS